MNKPIIKIGLTRWDYNGFISLGNTVVAALTGNASFPVPAIPLMDLQAAVTDVVNALALWAPPGSRGSRADLLSLRDKTTTLAQLLKAEAQYVMTTAQIAAGNNFEAMAAILSTSGYKLKKERQPQGVIQMPEGFQRVMSRQLAPNQVKLRWRRPLEVTSRGNVHDYRILRSSTPDFSTAVEVGSTTRTSFVLTNTTGSMVTWTLWVVAFGSTGAGVPSDALTVHVLPA